MKNILLIIIIIFVISCHEENNTSSTEPDDNNPKDTIEVAFSTDSLEVPTIKDGEIIYHSHYTLSYNEENELANWVAYELVKEELVKNHKRTNDFRPDPKVSTGTAEDEDYQGSGYDRGHLMPAADCTWELTAMSESFFYSNIAPQVAGLNRGEWSSLEEDFRDLAIAHDTVWIVTGPIFDSNIEVIGKNEVAVPGFYYKAGLYKENDLWKSKAYILPNTPIDNEIDMESFRVTIDSLENRIGYDLYPKLEDFIEEEIEKT